LTQDLRRATPEELRALLSGAEVLFHLAAEKHHSARSAKDIVDVNITATHRLFEVATQAGVRKIVFASSLYAYGSMGPEVMTESQTPEPRTVYGVSKLTGEHLLRTVTAGTDTSWAAARLFFVYGPRQYAQGGYKSVIISNFERIARGDHPTIRGDGSQALDYIYIDDAVRALRHLAVDAVPAGIYNVASGSAVSIGELTDLMIRTASTKLAPRFVPADWTAGSIRVGDASLIRATTGWRPRVGLEAGLKSTWGWVLDG
jgi:UDP-glucose 4-epimerase